MNTLIESNIPGATLFRRGKVRDVYEAGGDRLVIVASDRLPHSMWCSRHRSRTRAACSRELSSFWFDRTERVVRQSPDLDHVDEMPPSFREAPELEAAPCW
jgi:phosphoribosylaminoimidazole-succinocarboxamide synthase